MVGVKVQSSFYFYHEGTVFFLCLTYCTFFLLSKNVWVYLALTNVS